ncbi:MAG: 2,3,4,5-tetrahydropyridine-2,6-dicarboxylate N-acetyltransferase [Bacteroidetes bacterium]|nr:2,3,4,5-tetrahydropyridine-2,6-dicarboxylate N-acetyltransferase [Bacteroidota bacterium]
MDSYEIIDFIAKATKKTPVKAYLAGNLAGIDFSDLEFYGDHKWGVLFCEHSELVALLETHKEKFSHYRIENDRRHSAVPLLDLTKVNSRIEPGAIIRDKVDIGNNCVIMMGAVINIGAVIGDRTMIDMNVVVGGRAIVGKDCHIGAGTVLAGVIEPPNAEPVVVGDKVVIGANAVVLEGIKIGEGAVVAAGAIVVSDVEPYTVVAGVPARVIKKVDEKTKSKTIIMDSLRSL